MTYAEQLRALLRPLGVYELDAPINGSSLDAKGAALDRMHEWLEEMVRETDLTTAQDWGLTDWKSLFSIVPASATASALRDSLQALLRIGTGACTLDAVRDTLSGCGIPTEVEEAGTGMVKVRFPGIAGQPENFERLRANIEAILPAHVGIEYAFHYLTWAVLESRKWKFQDIEGMTWDELEKSV